MTMTGQHFQMIADVVKDFTFEGNEPKSSRALMALDFAARLQATNPNFDRARFLKACGVAQ